VNVEDAETVEGEEGARQNQAKWNCNRAGEILHLFSTSILSLGRGGEEGTAFSANAGGVPANGEWGGWVRFKSS
jgi:hypothetical protein